MRTLLSTRRQKFYSIIRAANDQTTDWLMACLVNPGDFMSPLAKLACLRVLACREASGLPYPQRKKAVKAKIANLVNKPAL